MKLSIIIPVYNVEKYILECLKSLKEFENNDQVEVIFINDGTKDTSAEIIENYINKIKNYKIFNKLNGGLSSARNFGLKKAKGNYVYFLDSDDIFNTGIGKVILKDIEVRHVL